MSEFLKYLGEALHRHYDAVLQQPMPWNMIDKLVSLEEACEVPEASETLDLQTSRDAAALGGEPRTHDERQGTDT